MRLKDLKVNPMAKVAHPPSFTERATGFSTIFLAILFT
jgi:hypothetical protein